jgi:hypothetical protein
MFRAEERVKKHDVFTAEHAEIAERYQNAFLCGLGGLCG